MKLIDYITACLVMALSFSSCSTDDDKEILDEPIIEEPIAEFFTDTLKLSPDNAKIIFAKCIGETDELFGETITTDRTDEYPKLVSQERNRGTITITSDSVLINITGSYISGRKGAFAYSDVFNIVNVNSNIHSYYKISLYNYSMKSYVYRPSGSIKGSIVEYMTGSYILKLVIRGNEVHSLNYTSNLYQKFKGGKDYRDETYLRDPDNDYFPI